ncbi:MAG: hypothetical protein E6J74_01155 [Deltaproteobacteria bacterium]|jgi:hypothetical protein|nr:MAG: hypothetical protein E6J74_01155 [Deltaproteobacteria bacterium]
MSRVLKTRNADAASAKYATALRCIGQDLERRGLKSFDIRFERNEYVAYCGYQDPPSPTPVTIQYTFKDIQELDRAAEGKRGELSATKEFLNQVQIFRTIGGYLDKNEGQLIRLTNNDGTGKDSLFKVEYVTQDGERLVDDRAGTAIYDMCVTMYKQRGKLTGTGGRLSHSRRR